MFLSFLSQLFFNVKVKFSRKSKQQQSESTKVTLMTSIKKNGNTFIFNQECEIHYQLHIIQNYTMNRDIKFHYSMVWTVNTECRNLSGFTRCPELPGHTLVCTDNLTLPPQYSDIHLRNDDVFLIVTS